MNVDGASFFLDTNIFVYRVDSFATGKAERAGALIARGLRDGRGVTSYQVAQEFCRVVLRSNRQPMHTADVGRFLQEVFAPMVRVESSLDLVQRGLHLYERYRLPWYDALIVAAAQQARCAILYSEDFQHGQVFDSVRVVDPFR